jgi:hypothetical protein
LPSIILLTMHNTDKYTETKTTTNHAFCVAPMLDWIGD